MHSKLLFTADDRTGSLEIGGLVADIGHLTPVGPDAQSENVCVVDIATRHLDAAAAKEKMTACLQRPADMRAHKMDAGLRGNWAHEIQVLLDHGYKVAIVCSYPDAGRRCKDGVVYIHDKPVTESVFANDPLNLPISSRPRDVLDEASVVGDVEVWDANDNAEMYQRVDQALAEGRILVGASGVMGALAERVLPESRVAAVQLTKPLMLVCGSLNPLSRAQLEACQCTLEEPDQVQRVRDLIHSQGFAAVASPELKGEITDAEALDMAERLAQIVDQCWSQLGSLLIVGGDTVAAVVGDRTLNVLGNIAPGIPVSELDHVFLITKGGGIGSVNSLNEIVRKAN